MESGAVKEVPVSNTSMCRFFLDHKHCDTVCSGVLRFLRRIVICRNHLSGEGSIDDGDDETFLLHTSVIRHHY